MSDRPTRATPDDAGIFDKYLVHDAREIRRHVERLLDGRCTLLGHADGGAASTVTVLLQVDADGFVVDVPRSREDQRAWVASAKLFFDGSLERIALRFACGPALSVLHDGKPAFALPMPARMLYLQRREFLRVEPPIGALECRVPRGVAAGEDVGPWVGATIRDIGGGGLAILAPSEKIAFVVGDVLRGCEIDLPGSGPLLVNLRVRHVVARQRRGGEALQAGCEFVDLAPSAQDTLFRYVMQLDRQRAQRGRS